MANLIERSTQALTGSHIEKIWQAGIRRDPLTYHSAVMYPPLKAMNKISEQEIYSDFQNQNREFALYLHIPFCTGKCTFCYFCQIEQPASETIACYVNALTKEIELTGKKLTDHLGDVTISSLFFGGGSPTVLSNSQFKGLITAIKQQFIIADDIEITVEIHPEIMRNNARTLLEQYMTHNVNRLNIGIQSFEDTILQTTNRRHTAQEGIEIFELAREIGFDNINIDLLYPLPDLTPEIWEKTLTTSFDLEPESITTYFTAIRKPSLMYQLLHESPDRFPDEYTNHLFRIMAMEMAAEKEYDSRKLIDWFVKPCDRFHYNHQKSEVKRTEEIQLLSFGSGVFSYINHVQYYNYPDIANYCTMLREDRLPVWRGIRLTEDERLARAMVLGIKSGEVNIQAMEKTFGINVPDRYHPLLKKLLHLGLLEEENDLLRLSPKGILFADEVAVQFITDDMRNRSHKKDDIPESERELIESYNFMYDLNGLSFLVNPQERHS